MRRPVRNRRRDAFEGTKSGVEWTAAQRVSSQSYPLCSAPDRDLPLAFPIAFQPPSQSSSSSSIFRCGDQLAECGVLPFVTRYGGLLQSCSWRVRAININICCHGRHHRSIDFDSWYGSMGGTGSGAFRSGWLPAATSSRSSRDPVAHFIRRGLVVVAAFWPSVL